MIQLNAFIDWLARTDWALAMIGYVVGISIFQLYDIRRRHK